MSAYLAYRKVMDGSDAIALFGLPALRDTCPHLDAWLSRLEVARSTPAAAAQEPSLRALGDPNQAQE